MINLLSGTLSDSTEPNQDSSLSTMHLVVITCQLSNFQSGRPASSDPRPARRYGGVTARLRLNRLAHSVGVTAAAAHLQAPIEQKIPARRPGRPRPGRGTRTRSPVAGPPGWPAGRPPASRVELRSHPAARQRPLVRRDNADSDSGRGPAPRPPARPGTT